MLAMDTCIIDTSETYLTNWATEAGDVTSYEPVRLHLGETACKSDASGSGSESHVVEDVEGVGSRAMKTYGRNGKIECLMMRPDNDISPLLYMRAKSLLEHILTMNAYRTSPYVTSSTIVMTYCPAPGKQLPQVSFTLPSVVCWLLHCTGWDGLRVCDTSHNRPKRKRGLSGTMDISDTGNYT